MIAKNQVKALLRPLPGGIIEQKQGMSYVPGHEVKAALSRIFGPTNWDHTIHDVRLLWESESPSPRDQSKMMYRACYMVACTLRVRDYDGNPIFETTEYHAEANSNLPDRGEAHAMALTSAETYALRRAALDLGDAFGLHLYDGGSLVPLIKRTALLADPDSPLYEAPEEGPAEPAAEQTPAQAAEVIKDAFPGSEEIPTAHAADDPERNS